MPQVKELEHKLSKYKIRTSLLEMGEGFLAFPDPRKLSFQDKNLLKIRSMEKEKKEYLEVKPYELTVSCSGVEQCVITCPASSVCYTLPKTISQTHLICWRKLCPISQPSPATAAPKLLSRPLPLARCASFIPNTDIPSHLLDL